jgi:hypothetical protein
MTTVEHEAVRFCGFRGLNVRAGHSTASCPLLLQLSPAAPNLGRGLRMLWILDLPRDHFLALTNPSVGWG